MTLRCFLTVRSMCACALLPWLALFAGELGAQAPAAAAETLKAAVQRAVESNPEVQARWHAFRAAEDERDVAFGAYLPKVELTAGAGHEHRHDPTLQDGYHRDLYSLSLTQMLYDGFATRNEVRRLDSARLVRLFELQDASETAALEVTRAYLDVFRYRRLVELAEENYVRHRAVLDQLQSKVKAGVGRRVDLEQAAGRMALAEANLLTETSNLHDVSARYQRLVGSPPQAQMESPVGLARGLPGELASAVKQAQQSHPALLAAIENVRAAEAAVDVSNAAFQPRLDLRLRRDDGSNLNGLIGGYSTEVAEFVVTFNLFNGGSDTARVRQRAAEKNVAKDQRDKVCRDTRQTLLIAYNDTRKLGEQLVYLDRHQISTEKARDAYRKQFDIGQRSLLDLLDTENELFQARRSYVNAELDLDIARARTHAGVGSLLVALDVSRREAAQMPQVAPAPDELPEQCPPEGPATYVSDKARLDERAKELVSESVSMVPAPVPAAVPTARPVEPAPPMPPPASSEEARIENAVRAWVAAWSSRNIEAYLEAYGADFTPAGGIGRAEWEARRRRIIDKACNVVIKLDDLKIERPAPSRAIVSFKQDYQSACYSDVVLKALDMRQQSGRWLIKRESTQPVS